MNQAVISTQIEALSQLFTEHSDLNNAAAMSAYMRHQFDFFGIKTPLRKQLSKRYLRDHGTPSAPLMFAQACFEAPQRELQYFVGDWLRPRAKRLGPEWLPQIEALIIKRSWWDTVDFLSPSIAGPILAQDRALWSAFPDRWIHSENMWLRRSAILFQLKLKERVNEETLFRYCETCKSDSEFFVQKAMGWALREYTKTNPKAVLQFLDDHAMPALTDREARKWLKSRNAP